MSQTTETHYCFYHPTCRNRTALQQVRQIHLPQRCRAHAGGLSLQRLRERAARHLLHRHAGRLRGGRRGRFGSVHDRRAHHTGARLLCDLRRAHRRDRHRRRRLTHLGQTARPLYLDRRHRLHDHHRGHPPLHPDAGSDVWRSTSACFGPVIAITPDLDGRLSGHRHRHRRRAAALPQDRLITIHHAH